MDLTYMIVISYRIKYVFVPQFLVKIGISSYSKLLLNLVSQL